MSDDLVLYDYWRSSAAYRVRIALNLKGLQYLQHSIHLIKDGGQQHQADYVKLNPQHLIPTLIHAGQAIPQSLAIIEYLEECFPEPALLPTAPLAKARCRAMAQLIACDVHPLNNLRILQYLDNELAVSAEQKSAWYAEWIARGFAAYETLLERREANGFEQGPYSCGNTPSIADCCLLPQVYNARRFECDLNPYPRLLEVVAALEAHPAVAAALPERQADAA